MENKNMAVRHIDMNSDGVWNENLGMEREKRNGRDTREIRKMNNEDKLENRIYDKKRIKKRKEKENKSRQKNIEFWKKIRGKKRGNDCKKMFGRVEREMKKKERRKVGKGVGRIF